MPIAITRTDGGVSIMRPHEGTDIAAEIEKWKELHTGEYVLHQELPESAIPSDRTFRDAWKAGNGVVEHDMAKAREIHKDRLRGMRAPKLASLDVDYIRADESGDSAKKAAIKTQKQALRDVTADPRIAAAMTPEELAAIVPDALKV